MTKLVEMYDEKCCEKENLHEYSDDCECCVNTCWNCAESLPQEDYPEVIAVLPFVESLAPKDFVITYEYENSIGIKHPSFTDDQMIMFGDVNGYFSFNDSFASKVCGDMERTYDPKEIAESFWNQISKIYPELTKEQN